MPCIVTPSESALHFLIEHGEFLTAFRPLLGMRVVWHDGECIRPDMILPGEAGIQGNVIDAVSR